MILDRKGYGDVVLVVIVCREGEVGFDERRRGNIFFWFCLEGYFYFDLGGSFL